jgi:hypothetical protein
MAALTLAGCQSIDVPPEPPPGPISTDAQGASGYQHGGVGVSKFAVGDDAKRTLALGYLKLSGDEGTLAIRQTNGSVFAVPNAHAQSLQLPPYGGSPQDHDRFVKAYFVALGLPAAQVKRVHAMTLVEASGRTDEAGSATPRVSAYYSVLDRAVGNTPVPDSFAWARVNAQGVVVQEGVYWPAIPGKVLADAKRLNDMLADRARRQAFQSRLPVDAATASVAIRHASASEDQFEAFASVDITVHADVAIRGADAGNATNAANARQGSVSGGATFVRHFDIDGTERFLPQERLNLTRQYPATKSAQQ